MCRWNHQAAVLARQFVWEEGWIKMCLLKAILRFEDVGYNGFAGQDLCHAFSHRQIAFKTWFAPEMCGNSRAIIMNKMDSIFVLEFCTFLTIITSKDFAHVETIWQDQVAEHSRPEIEFHPAGPWIPLSQAQGNSHPATGQCGQILLKYGAVQSWDWFPPSKTFPSNVERSRKVRGEMGSYLSNLSSSYVFTIITKWLTALLSIGWSWLIWMVTIVASLLEFYGGFSFPVHSWSTATEIYIIYTWLVTGSGAQRDGQRLVKIKHIGLV